MVSPSDFLTIPLDDWVNFLVKDWLVPNFRPAFRVKKHGIAVACKIGHSGETLTDNVKC